MLARTRASPPWLQSGHLIAFASSLSPFIRRLQDAGYSPWMTLFVLAGPLGAVVFLVLLTQPTVSGAPKFKDNTRIPTVTGSVRSPAWTANLSFERPVRSQARIALLGGALLTTLVILAVSAVYVPMPTSVADASAEASASRASVAAVSRAKAAAAASASASASVLGEADRQAKFLQDQRDA